MASNTYFDQKTHTVRCHHCKSFALPVPRRLIGRPLDYMSYVEPARADHAECHTDRGRLALNAARFSREVPRLLKLAASSNAATS